MHSRYDGPRLLARHLEWASTTDAARNQAFNVVNGDVFRWKWMWGRLAAWFGLQPAAFPGESLPLERQMSDARPIWTDIARKHHLAERISTGWQLRGTPMGTSVGRSRWSPTRARVVGWDSLTIRRRTKVS